MSSLKIVYPDGRELSEKEFRESCENTVFPVELKTHHLTEAGISASVVEEHETRETLVTNLLVKLSAWRLNEEQAYGLVITFEGRRWPADRVSLDRVARAVLGAEALGALPDGFTWRSEDNEDVPMDLDSMKALRDEMNSFHLKLLVDVHERQLAIKEELKNLDAESLEQYRIGWGTVTHPYEPVEIVPWS